MYSMDGILYSADKKEMRENVYMMEDETLVLYAYVCCSPFNVMYKRIES